MTNDLDCGYRQAIQENFEEHLARNVEAQRAKANDKQRASENASFQWVTFELQLQVP